MRLGEMPLQFSTSSRWEGDKTLTTKNTEEIRKGRIPQLESGISKSESIFWLNVQRIGRRTFGECSENAADSLPQGSTPLIGSRRKRCPNQSALVSQ